MRTSNDSHITSTISTKQSAVEPGVDQGSLRGVHFVQGAPKLKVAIVGGGLAALSTAVELLEQG